jgi:hypothetical protein
VLGSSGDVSLNSVRNSLLWVLTELWQGDKAGSGTMVASQFSTYESRFKTFSKWPYAQVIYFLAVPAARVSTRRTRQPLHESGPPS